MVERVSTPGLIGFRFGSPVFALSSGMLGGGYSRARSLVNLYVDKSYAGMDPGGDILRAVRQLGLPEPAVGLMTAVKLAHADYAERDGVHVLVTAGVSNAEAAGLTPAWRAGVGTINIIALVPGQASEAALAGAAITVTEAKVRALQAAGVRCPATGELATGTSSDAFAIACTGAGEELPFLGPVTAVGFTLASLVYEAVRESLRKGGWER